MKDVFGKALLDYYHENHFEDIVTWTNISDKDILPLLYLFRSFSEMPKLEKEALRLCKGTILDVGCGSGSHSLWLQNKGFNVKAIDRSRGAIEVAQQRGVLNTELKSLLDETDTFDTILLLMNGTGIFQEVSQVSKYLRHLKSLLRPNGQILMDSSDISYMYSDGFEAEIKSESRYYGELDYYISYKGEEEVPMKWLYLDFETLKTACLTLGLRCEKVLDGKHFDYLARLS
ncbi:class I SAM-dependent methyltransferase [Winogradskyella luteola]|uniref:Methyltransferase domain-containing protein n=1 Tax=Winogradskyella luteola TaxID=2828330 RepID=A0A9X1FAS6_9FLAO|nr:methyltransferase domain-containing protein [Winogradskyella luteola]MBV7270420.1 methyltransferase domain-containing protein [Winogradskyella luteola]